METIISTGRSLLEEGKTDEAIAYFEKQITAQSNAEAYATLGKAYYLKEQYDKAADAYGAALKLEPKEEWKALYEFSKTNAVAEVHVPIPEVYYFDKEQLLAKPVVPEGALPKPPPDIPPPNIFKLIGNTIGDYTGHFLTKIMEFLGYITGTLLGYRDKVWTNWYRRPFILAILTLAYMREKTQFRQFTVHLSER